MIMLVCKINIFCLHNGHSLFSLLQSTTFAHTTARGIQTKYKYFIIQTKQNTTPKYKETKDKSDKLKNTKMKHDKIQRYKIQI